MTRSRYCGGVRRLIVGVDLIVEIVVLDRALRAIGVGRGKRGPNVLKADAVVKYRAGIDLDPHRRQRAADDVDLADAGKLRQPLLQDVGGQSYSCPAVRVVDVIAMTMIGASAGLTLW